MNNGLQKPVPDKQTMNAALTAIFDSRKCWESDAIEDFIDHDAWGGALEIERVEKESMQNFHQQWKRQIKQGAA